MLQGVSANGRTAATVIVASGSSQGGRDYLGLIPGRRLVAGASLRAASWDASQASVPIMAAPRTNADLPPMTIVSTLYECGVGVRLSGGFPGAAVQVLTGSPERTLGTAIVGADGWAMVSLTSPIPAAGSTVKAVQAAPPGFPPLLAVPAAQPVSAQVAPLAEGAIPKLMISGTKDGTLPGCASSIVMTDSIPGAVIHGTFGHRASARWHPRANRRVNSAHHGRLLPVYGFGARRVTWEGLA